MTSAELVILLTAELKGMASNFNAGDFTNAIDDAQRDTGWSLPLSTNFKIKWLKDRAKRHLFFYWLTEQANKFKYKQINLQDRFDHFFKLINQMDKDFEAIIEKEPHFFMDAEAYKIFGHKIDAGFNSESQTGVDLTYSNDIEIIVTPNENS